MFNVTLYNCDNVSCESEICVINSCLLVNETISRDLNIEYCFVYVRYIIATMCQSNK